VKYRWSLAPAQPSLAAELSAALQLSALLAQCLLNRGLTDPARAAGFLEPRLKHLSDPFLLPDMGRAVERLFRARQQAEPITIFGDFDVDGITSTALLVEVLGRLGWRVAYYLPHRLEEGYGLSQDGIENCLRQKPAKLLLAVDCGSTAVASIAWLKQQGVDTVVLDHHQVSAPQPETVALINPQLQDACGRNFRELCSVGLAFKLAHALVKYGRQNGLPEAAEFDLRPLLDLVALGTIADLVPLIGENRILVSAGLDRLNRTQRPGLVALRRVAQAEGYIGPVEVGFQLAPRLNAAGRLEHALQSLELLLAKDASEADPLAEALDAQNRSRQQIERKISDQVVSMVRGKFNPQTDFVVVEGDALWHRGVVGIVASRVAREFYRPTIIVGGNGEEWHGSGRSIDGFDLAAALCGCADLLTRHGGHAMAAGLSLPTAHLERFRNRLNEIARQTLSPDCLQPVLYLDAEAALQELGLEQVHGLNRLQPLGQANPAVQLLARGLRQQRPPQRLGKEQQHLKMWVTDGRRTLEALWWQCNRDRLPDGAFDLAFAPEINEFNGRRSVQMKVLDWRPAQ
jgi:single-stranded-DNA-specific exonuclease